MCVCMLHRALIKFDLNDAFRIEVAKENAMGKNECLAIRKDSRHQRSQRPDAAGDIVVTSSPDNESRIRQYKYRNIYYI